MRKLGLARWTLTVALTLIAAGATYYWSRAANTPPTVHRVSGFGPAFGVSEKARIPAEFERQDALLLGVNELIELHPQTLVDIVRAIEGRLHIVGLISKPDQEQRTLALLHSHSVSTSNLHFFLWPAPSMWVQDFGPLSLVNGDVQIIDFDYHHLDRDVENQLPLAFAATYGMKITHCRLSLEGGNFLSNGRGLCVSSTALIAQNQPRGYDLQTIASILRNDFRFTQWSYLVPLSGEPTGHLDMYCTLTSEGTAVLASYDPREDAENATKMDENARTLAASKVDGKPVTVVRVPSPPHHDGKWRTYTNVIFANGVLLVPQYPDFSPELDRKAIEVYRSVLPGWKVVGVNASTIINQRGSLHCLSLNLPVMPNLTASE